MKKMFFFLLICVSGSPIVAQDTIIPFVDTNSYLFNPCPSGKNVVSIYSPVSEDTINLQPATEMNFCYAGGIMGGMLMQSYTPSHAVNVVGIAVTMAPYWYDGKANILHRGFPNIKDVDCLRYRTLLADSKVDTINIYDMFNLIDSLFYDDSTVLKKKAWFNYGKTTPIKNIDSNIIKLETHDSIAPCVEFYFNQPVGTYSMNKTFYVGTRYYGSLTIYPQNYCYGATIFKKNAALRPGEFVRAVYKGNDSDTSSWGYHIWTDHGHFEKYIEEIPEIGYKYIHPVLISPRLDT